MSQVMEHVHQLAGVIGPRPATTDAEAQAADYLEDVFRARGLDVERQEFDCPRTYSWAFIVYHALTLGAAALSLVWSWPAFAIAAASAVTLWLDLDTRFSITRFLPKGPSQNVIARHVPRARRGERLRRVVIVAHYDSTKSSLAFSPGMVKNFSVTFALMKWTTVATPLVILLGALPFAATWKPWTGYAAIAAAAYLLVPLLINLHRELFMQATDGANDNASGVAAMLGVMEATVPEPDELQRRSQPMRRTPVEIQDAGVVPDDAILEYRDVREPAVPVAQGAMPFDGMGDVGWETGPMPATEPAPIPPDRPLFEPSEPVAPEPESAAAPLSGDWADADAGGLWEETPARESSGGWDADRPVYREEVEAGGQERLDLEPAEEPPARRGTREPAPQPDEEHHEREGHGIRAWLGIGRGFDVRRAGQHIGSWDNIDADDDDEFGFKAGTAGDEPEEDLFVPLPPSPGTAATDEAARIRRRVTEGVDRALAEKEIWFVATGAEEAGTWGMRALLEAYPDELRDAVIINIDNVGSGTVTYVTDEGMARRYRADRRLTSQAKRTARENMLPVKARSYRGLSTDATPALARGYRAMSVMAFDINGRLPDWHWHTDTVENVSPATVEAAATFVTTLLRDL